MDEFQRYAKAVAEGIVCEHCLAKFAWPHNVGCPYDDESCVGGHAGAAAWAASVANLVHHARWDPTA